jgi:hypothetical protein
LNFARLAVHYWNLAEEKEELARRAAEELKERHGVVVSHPIRDEAIGMQRHYLRKAHTAAAIALVLHHTWDMDQGI